MTTATATCLHLRRTFPSPNGPELPGTCVACGDVRMYPASPEEALDPRFKKSVDRALDEAHKARRKSPLFNTAIFPASKPMTVYTKHEAPAPKREKAPKPAGEPKAKREKKPRASRPHRRSMRLCVGCGAEASFKAKDHTPRCRACYYKDVAAVVRHCACGAEINYRSESCRACVKPRALNAEQEAILAYIETHDGTLASEIAEALGFTPSSMSQRLGKLRSRGLIEKRVSPVNPTWGTYHLTGKEAPAAFKVDALAAESAREGGDDVGHR